MFDAAFERMTHLFHGMNHTSLLKESCADFALSPPGKPLFDKPVGIFSKMFIAGLFTDGRDLGG